MALALRHLASVDGNHSPRPENRPRTPVQPHLMRTDRCRHTLLFTYRPSPMTQVRHWAIGGTRHTTWRTWCRHQRGPAREPCGCLHGGIGVSGISAGASNASMSKPRREVPCSAAAGPRRASGFLAPGEGSSPVPVDTRSRWRGAPPGRAGGDWSGRDSAMPLNCRPPQGFLAHSAQLSMAEMTPSPNQVHLPAGRYRRPAARSACPWCATALKVGDGCVALQQKSPSRAWLRRCQPGGAAVQAAYGSHAPPLNRWLRSS